MILANHGIISSSGGVSIPLLLDTYSGASAAYSLRKLNTAYTGNAITVRRSSDNTSQSFGFDLAGYVDIASITTFLNTSQQGYVTTWFDQSGNGNNATQPTAANQPFIKKDGSFIAMNSKNAFLCENGYFLMGNILTSTSSSSVFWLGKNTFTSSVNGNTIWEIGTPDASHFKYTNGVTYDGFSSTTRKSWTDSINYSNRNLINAYSQNGLYNIYVNNSSIYNTTTNTYNITSINNLGNAAYFGNMQEFILYPSNQTINRAGIATDINTYYSVY